MQRATSAFPWQQLPRVSLAAARARAQAGRWWRTQFRSEALSEAFRELFDMELGELRLLGFGPCEVDGISLGADVQLLGEGVSVRLSFPPELIGRVVGSTTNRPKRVDTGDALSEPMRGAMHAIVAELCRQSARGAPLLPSQWQSRDTPWRADFSFRLGGASYRAIALLNFLEGAFGPPERLTPDPLPLSLPLVIATAVATPSQLESLRRGDAFIFSDEPRQSLVGASATLCAPHGERGLAVSIEERGLLLHGPVELSYELEEPMSEDENSTAHDTIAEAPVVVRIELGKVTMSVAEWLSLAPGEVLNTEVRLGSPAILRSNGRVVGSGELINVDGHVGVRITQLAPDDSVE